MRLSCHTRSVRNLRRKVLSAATLITFGAFFASLACASSRGKAVARPPGEPIDTNACTHICAASAACGEAVEACEPKCRDWLVNRSRPGIATATAKCAVPRIDEAWRVGCSERAAASALVGCIDEAGKASLLVDREPLVLAARAICERGARCNNASLAEANRCVAKITDAPKIPKGLGIFGAIKPELVERFASCMASSQCGDNGGAGACFGEMLGEEEGGVGPGNHPPPPATSASPDDAGGIKI